MRDIISLNGLWDYKVDSGQKGAGEGWAQNILPVDATWSRCWLPQAGALIERTLYEGFKGDLWFYRSFAISKELADRYMELCFSCVIPAMEVYLDGKLLGKSDNGARPLAFPLPKGLPQETTIPLIIRIMNVGMVDRGLVNDWFGVLGDIELKCIGQLEIVGHKIRAYPMENYTKGHVDITIEIENRFGLDVYAQAVISVKNRGVTVFDKQENFKALKDTPSRVSVSFEIDKAQPWSLDTPHLYDLDIKLARTNQIQDNIAIPFGIRELKYNGTQFLCNNKPVALIGTMYRACPPGVGPFPSPTWIQQDLRTQKMMGLNLIYSNFPIPKSVLEIADQLGLLIIESLSSSNAEALIVRDQAHPCLLGFALNKKDLAIPLEDKFGRSGQFLFTSENLQEQSTSPLIITCTGTSSLQNVGESATPRFLWLQVEAIAGNPGMGSEPFSLKTEESQAKAYSDAVSLVQISKKGITGVICGEWQDEGSDFPCKFSHIGILSSKNIPKASYYAIKGHLIKN